MMCERGLREVHMVSASRIHMSTKIARQTPTDRTSRRTQNSTRSRRASTNGSEFDAHTFLAAIGEGRKAVGNSGYLGPHPCPKSSEIPLTQD